MSPKGITGGVFVTTGRFTNAAGEYASTVSHLRLIDGEGLVRLMVETGIGVRPLKTFVTHSIDGVFFEEDRKLRPVFGARMKHGGATCGAVAAALPFHDRRILPTG